MEILKHCRRDRVNGSVTYVSVCVCVCVSFHFFLDLEDGRDFFAGVPLLE